MRRMIITSLIAGAVLALSGTAEARRWGGGPGHGHGPGMWGERMGGLRHCGKMLMHMPPEELKAKLKLDDKQLARAEALRDNLANKHIDLKAKLAKDALKLRKLMEADLPDQGKVLAQMRRMRSTRGVLAEEKVKAYLGFLSLLNAEQRKQVRELCHRPGRGFGKGWGPGRRGGHGGRGWGPGGPGGPGGGPGWGAPPPPPAPGK